MKLLVFKWKCNCPKYFRNVYAYFKQVCQIRFPGLALNVEVLLVEYNMFDIHYLLITILDYFNFNKFFKEVYSKKMKNATVPSYKFLSIFARFNFLSVCAKIKKLLKKLFFYWE